MLVRIDDKSSDTPILVRLAIGDIHFSKRAAIELRDKLIIVLKELKEKNR